MDLSIKTTFKTAVLITLFHVQAWATDVRYVPAFCTPQSLTLKAQNTTSEMQRLWTQVRIDDEIQERHHDLAPHAKLEISAQEFLSAQQAFSVKSWNKNSLKISVSCNKSLEIPLNDFTSPQVTHRLPSSVKTVRLHVLNLFLKPNTITLRAYSKWGALLESKEHLIEKHYDTQTLKWSFSEDIGRIEVIGSERLHSWLFYDLSNDEKMSPSQVFKPVALSPSNQKTYFLVSTKEARPEEAFVIALDEPQQIATAREQIRDPSLEKIIVAGIELGHGGFNRAFLSKDKAPYSWSVNQVSAFADFAHIDCDGSPDLTEERLSQKLSEGGRICFWRYRVIKEISLQEVSSGRLKP